MQQTTNVLNDTEQKIIETIGEYGIVNEIVLKKTLYGELNRKDEIKFVKYCKGLQSAGIITIFHKGSDLENYFNPASFKLTKKGKKLVIEHKLDKKEVIENINVNPFNAIEDIRSVLRDFDKRLNDLERTARILVKS